VIDEEGKIKMKVRNKHMRIHLNFMEVPFVWLWINILGKDTVTI
jgi:hypothetical protein